MSHACFMLEPMVESNLNIKRTTFQTLAVEIEESKVI